ncbi:hypothetical protein H5125_05040 [Shewanella sp. SR44-4]|uniref:hypothetical protein n=1 Tax=Shewanella sp. SR44-4 TaxID=2760935 RepID=UPI001604890D|nr:hypothetical protein [Shewanella sp. SR44-4]MBB1361521.1 hypothetical protein [Shewanella sp. SR44-4]
MSKVLSAFKGVPAVLVQAMVEVDADVAAERIVVIDRSNLTPIHHMFNSQSGVVQIIVPLIYGSSNNLIVGILDDDSVFDCKFIDSVRPQLINANDVKMVR